MKKIYSVPTTEVVICEVMEPLAGSEVISGDYGIEYGGIDGEGKNDPASRFLENLWQ